MVRRFLILAFVSLVAASAAARDLHVDNVTGDDRNNGESPTVDGGRLGPMRTIGRALKAAGKGDRIIIANTGEPYRESLTIQGGRLGGDGVRPLVIVGNQAVLDGTVAIAADAWQHETGEVFSTQPELLGQQMLYLDGRPAKRVAIRSTAELDQLEPLQWTWLEGRIYFRPEKDRLPDAYDLRCCGHPVGITLYAVAGVTISDLTVQGFQYDAVSAADDVRDAHLVGMILRGNGRSGLHVGGASRVKLEATLVGDNGKAQVHCTDHCQLELVTVDLIDADLAAPAVVAEPTAKVLRDTP